MNSPLQVISSDHLETDVFDLLIAAVGFEARSSYLARRLRSRYKFGLAFAFAERRCLNFQANLDWYAGEGFTIENFSDELPGFEFIRSAVITINSANVVSDIVRIVVDVSSMSRPMIAKIITWISSLPWEVEVTFAYCPSAYVDLGDQIYTMSYVGPVTPNFAGWTDDTRRRLVAIVGLGGERGLALGAIEYLEATDVWVLIPTGIDKRYDAAAESANAELLARIGHSRIIAYNPLDGFGCFCTVESLVYGLLKADRPILIPFGPKIMTAASLLAAQIFRPNAPVWRVSSEQSGEPVDREATGDLSTITAVFKPQSN
ncbi:MAG TPA: hypothetical protein VGK90_09575 [Rhizomicrobium sp.]|jgi:hypothetical protein